MAFLGALLVGILLIVSLFLLVEDDGLSYKHIIIFLFIIIGIWMIWYDITTPYEKETYYEITTENLGGIEVDGIKKYRITEYKAVRSFVLSEKEREIKLIKIYKEDSLKEQGNE